MKSQALGELDLTLMEYYDLTLNELTAQIAGYNVRWEEDWKQTRALYTLLFNINSKKKKSAQELIPLPSEASDIAFQKWVNGLEGEMILEETVKEVRK